MLQDIRNNAQSTIAKIIIVLLVIGLSMFGVDAIIGGFSGEPEVATVNGQDITERQFTRTVQMQRQRQLAQMDNPDPSLINEDQIRQSVLEGLIRQAVLTQDAEEQGLILSDRDIDSVITSMSQFQVDGEFSRDAFVAGVRNLGMGVAEFREALRKEFVVNQIRSGITSSAIVNPQNAEAILRIQSQTRTFQTLEIPASAVADQVEVSDADIQEYYDEHKSEFLQSESVDVNYITLSVDDLASQVDVSEDEVRDLYEQRKADLGGDEQRRASHILIEDGDDAQAKLKEVQQKLADGEDFAKVAEEYSADTATATQGGDLGYSGKGVYDSAFEQALFSLEDGEVSEPVETQFGYHIIKLTGVRETQAPSFEDMKDKLRQEVAREKAGQTFSEIRTQLADISYSEPTLESPAEQLGLTIQTRDGIKREGNQAPFDHQGLVRQLYSDDVLSGEYNTEVIDVDKTTAVVAHVSEHHPEEQLALDAVSEQIQEKLRAEKIRAALADRSKALVARLQDGDAPADIAADADAEWMTHEAVSRNASDVDFDVIRSAFSMPRPQGDTASYDWVGGAERAVVLSLSQVTDGEVDGQETQMQALNQFLTQQRGQSEYAAYVDSLRDSAEVERP
ncbi:SurA N-terminal domain-containing protein [Marinobacter sp. JSM 1782161]|uniref:SurA N-terminal domain-containing protein n=1 Tax=Marinobacter sp. JSM 1782161 TaxID=2685906 RepID=UPI0014034E94|nr:SurA N-terminal domain-containing protein [Marinobacter sp. JSM 1782161]